MRNYRAIIVDDQQASIDVLLGHFEKVELVKVDAYFTDPFRALRYVRVNPVDLVILDVDLGDRMDGFEWIAAIPKLKLKFILYTGFKQFEDQGYLMNVVDVLLKPVSYPRFVAGLRRMDADMRLQMPDNYDMDSLDHSNSYLQIRRAGKWNMQLVWFREVIYIEAQTRYVHIHMATDEQLLLSNSSFSYILDLLPKKWFKQCARGIAFNVNFFHSYQRRKVKLNLVKTDIPTGDIKNYPDFREFLENNSV